MNKACRYFVLLLAIVCGRTASAQITSAMISGTVKDQTGSLLPGVDIALKNLETGLTRFGITGEDGSYRIPGLPPGLYEARGSLQGFTTAMQSGIVLAVAEQARRESRAR